MNYRIAVASSDGKEVDLHFGHAYEFMIYDMDDKGYSYLESRNCNPCCRNQSHSENRFDKVIRLLSDCDVIFVSQIGSGAAEYMIRNGVRVFEAPYRIDEVIEIVIEQRLLEES